VERTHAWGNAFGKLGWCTERHRQAELLSDPLGWPVARVDDGDQPLGLEDVAGVVAAGCRGFGGQATALERRANVVADLELGHAVDRLRG
jgi:hypothetical protein